MQENGQSPKAPLVLQFNMVRGRPQEEGPFIRIHAMKEDGLPAYFFILTEAEGLEPEETCTKVAESLLLHFSGGPPSITGRLQAALKRTHEGLLAENFRVPPEQRATVGVVCAYLRSPDLYLAYVGPGLAYLIGPHQGRCLAPIPGDVTARLGSPRSQQVWTRHHRLLPEETLLLASSELATLTDASLLYASFRGRLEDGMASVYRVAADRPSFAAVAIAPRLQWSEIDAKTPAVVGDLINHGKERPRLFAEPFRERPLPETPPLTGKSWEPISALNLGLSLDPKLPGRYPSRYGGRWLRPLVAGLAGLFLLGGLVAGAQAVMESGHQRAVAQGSALVERAQSLWGEAEAAPSKDVRRQRLIEASQLLEEAGQRASADETGASGLVRQVKDALDRLDAVQPLQDIRLVADVPALLGRQVLLRDPSLREDRLELLDKLGNQVLDLPLSAAQGGGARTVVNTIYPARGTDTGRISKLIWLPRSGQWPRDSLFAIDEGGGLTELGAQGEPRQIALRGTQAWQSFQAAAAANGALYILDPKGNQVARHAGLAVGTTFDTPTRSTPTELDLSDTVDLFVDTEMYILSRAGRIVKLSAGRPQPFTLDGLDQPMVNPTAIASRIGAKNLYVLDGNNKRIVVFRKGDGAFIRQHPLGDLPPLYALLLDQERGRLMLMGETQVYSAVLPGE